MSASTDIAKAQSDLAKAQSDRTALASAINTASTDASNLMNDLTTIANDLSAIAADMAPTPLALGAVANVGETVGKQITAIALTATGGTSPYTFSATGLPAGLSVSGATITGTPTAAGTDPVVVTVKDSAGATASAGFTMTVAAAPAPQPTPPTPAPPATTKILLGVYCGAGDIADVKSWGTDYSKTISLISTYCDGTSPSSLAQGDWQLGKYNGCGLRLVIGVNVYFGNGNQQANLATGAQGGFNSAYQQLAQNLIANGQPNAILRIGWEPDVNIFSNDDLTSAANYAKFFQQIRQTMMAVSGAKFVFSWYYGSAFDANTINTSYPGDAFADCIELDPYDQSWAGGSGAPPYNGSNFTQAQSDWVWQNDIVKRLGAQAAFAKAHGKPLCYGEWGVINRSDGHGGGDDPEFVKNMVNWMNSNNFMWASYFNFNSGGNSVMGNYPNSGAQLKSMALG